MGDTRAHDVAMHLIGNNRHMVFCAQLAYARQIAVAPHIATRILRIAQNHQTGERIGELVLEVVEIHRVRAVLITQRVAQYSAPVVHYRIREDVIDRRLEHDLLGHIRQRADQ